MRSNDSDLKLREARFSDIERLAALIDLSVRQLQAADYTEMQREGALGTVFGVDRSLIADGTYLVVECGDALAACGGWSRRKTLFGSDNVPGKDDALLDPAVDAARIRAMFVHPDWARRGLGTRILQACERRAAEAGFSRLELAATLTGVPLYRRYGFEAMESYSVPLPNGAGLPVVRMGRAIRLTGGDAQVTF